MISKEQIIKTGREILLSGLVAGGVVAVHEFLKPVEANAGGGPQVVIKSPPEGVTLATLRADLVWEQFGPDVTQMQFQMIPFNNDGPAVNIIRGDLQQRRYNIFTVPEPRITQKELAGADSATNLTTLPDMTYTWRVRASTSPTATDPTRNDTWGSWSERRFRTPSVSWEKIDPIEPAQMMGLYGVDSSDPMPQVDSLTPRLRWINIDRGWGESATFYYEVQVSRDPNFRTEPGRAIYPVQWQLINGGATNPLNTYRVPTEYPLDGNSIYYWRVRPRVQGDGRPTPWGRTWDFKTP